VVLATIQICEGLRPKAALRIGPTAGGHVMGVEKRHGRLAPAAVAEATNADYPSMVPREAPQTGPAVGTRNGSVAEPEIGWHQ